MISVILPNYNGRKLLEKNLPGIIKALRKWHGNSEIIVVDDASTDDSVLFLKENYPDIHLVVHQVNQRFAKTCNDGVDIAKGEIIVLLNTDVSPQEDFLKPLMEVFKDKEIFAAGCLEKSRINGKEIISGRALGKFERGFLVHRRAADQNKPDTLWALAGSSAYSKDIWLKLGGMDTLFKPAYAEDLDISYRALKSGYKIVFVPESKVSHNHETTNLAALGKNKMKIAAYKNQIIFVWKNITDGKLLLNHFFWLPYHLLFDTVRTNGLFLIGFLQALVQLGKIIAKRKRVKSQFILSDSEILERFS
jgi:GT2 family glycosyltransferase